MAKAPRAGRVVPPLRAHLSERVAIKRNRDPRGSCLWSAPCGAGAPRTSRASVGRGPVATNGTSTLVRALLKPDALNYHRLDSIRQHLDDRIHLVVVVTAGEREKFSQHRRRVPLSQPRVSDPVARTRTEASHERGRLCRRHTRRGSHVIYSDRQTKPFPIRDLDRPPAHLGVVHHGGGALPFSTMIRGHFTLSQPLRGRVLELLPPLLLLKPKTDDDWLEAILQRMVSESAVERPGQRVALSRMTEVLFVEVLRCWIKSLRPGAGGWLGAMADPHIGPALQLIHEQLDRPWTLHDLGRHVGLGRSAFSERFTRLVGQSMGRRMAEAAFFTRIERRGDCANC
jgi:hypothetical protein